MEYRPPTAWPALHPPLLMRLPRPPVHPNQASLPPSQRYRSNQFPTLQDEAEQLEWDEDQWLNSLHDTRGFGFTWLVPLGRQNTQEEDAESAYSSPRATSPEQPEDGAILDGEEIYPEEQAVEDLDAQIEDADASGTTTETEEEDEPSGVQERSVEEFGMDSLEEVSDNVSGSEGRVQRQGED